MDSLGSCVCGCVCMSINYMVDDFQYTVYRFNDFDLQFVGEEFVGSGWSTQW